MSARVLSSQQAQDAIGRLQSLINNDFMDQINQMNSQGQVLSEPDVWDGPLAETFRGETWPEVHTSLLNAQKQLEELRGQLQKISADIFAAGGQS